MGSNCCMSNKKVAEPQQAKIKHKRKKGRRNSTTTSYCDIRKVYKFTTKILGHGNFGTVRLACEQNNEDRFVAVKTIQKNKIKQKKYHLLKRELTILKNLDHPNIVNFFETYQDQKYLHLVTEYCSGGELLDRFTEMDSIDEEYVSRIMSKIFSAIHYLHKCGICHRDIKPENFMFLNKNKDSEIKVIDFGLSRKFEPNNAKTLDSVVGTPLYVAPEVLKQKYDYRCDNWSLGVLMYVLLSGNAPFLGHNRKSVFKKIARVDYNFQTEEWENVSLEAKDLISKLLVKNVKERWTLEQAMNHEWITNNMEKYKINSTIINRLSTFQYQSEFKKVAVKTLVEAMKEADINQLREQFTLLDKDKTGYINYEELQQALENTGTDITTEEWKSLTKNLKVDKKTGINYTTFIAGTLDRREYFTKERLWHCFKHFDVDNTNYITIPNLKEAMARDGRKIPKDSLERMLKEVDIKDNDMIDFDEFLRLMNVEEEVDLFRAQSLQKSDFKFANLSERSLTKERQSSTGIQNQIVGSQEVQLFQLEKDSDDVLL